MNLTSRGIYSFSWNFTANLIKIPVGFVQAVILARLLPVEYFGVYTGILALTQLSSVLFDFGTNKAFIYHSPETEDIQKALMNLLSLKIVMTSIWAILLIIIASFFMDGISLLAIIVVSISTIFRKLTDPPRVLLIREVSHRRIALIQTANSILVAMFSITIAIIKPSIWALLVSNMVTALWFIISFYVWKPVWKPKLAWDLNIIHYYINFGKKTVVGDFLNTAMDRIDDLWTNIFLGNRLLGFYSRAFKFATYPRLLLTAPVNSVSLGIYAEVKEDRRKLSKAFNHVVGFIIRIGFLLTGLLAWVAPNFIILFLGAKWMPMLATFRIMSVFLLLDPVRLTVSSILIALGKPEKVSQTSFIQFVILIMGLFYFGLNYEIEGVAIAVDIMLVIGVVLLFYYIKPNVDYSLIKLFGAPSLSLFLSMIGTWTVIHYWDYQYTLMVDGVIKVIIFSVLYFLLLFIFEGKEMIKTFQNVYADINLKGNIRELFF